jgi:RNA polymerase sigma-70 factor (ECF subfamily)
LLENVLERLRAEMARSNQAYRFEQLKLFLTGEKAGVGYAELGAQLGISEGAVKVAVHRLRRRFRDLLREEIAQTVSSAEEIEDEMRYLWSAVGR